jgi:DNA sulfur modification protein DndD
MKLIRARFDGFRLLREVEIEFSTDDARNITVIRAANESGKTTMLSALQWGLFGEAALPGSFTLAPMDLPTGALSDTTVEIDYEVEGKRGPSRFRLVRSVTTKVDAGISAKSTLQLYELLPTGANPLGNANAVIAAHMPTELREVFFTDGDRALSFIEGSRSEQQKRVRLAIEQMMGLPRLTNAIDHLRKVEKDIRDRLSGETGSEELTALKRDIDSLDQLIPELEEKFEAAKDDVARLTELHQKADRELQDALKRGNREEIAAELQSISKNMDRAEASRRGYENRQAALLSNKTFASSMLRDKMEKAGKLLEELRAKGQIPNKTIPILEDRLEHSDCICGESLDNSSDDGRRRRKAILALIEESRGTDALKAKVSDLYYEGKELFISSSRKWVDDYRSAFEERDNLDAMLQDLGEQKADLEARLALVADDNVQQARDMRDTYAERIAGGLAAIGRHEAAIRQRKELRTESVRKFEVLSARQSKTQRLAAELTVAKDVKAVFEKSLEVMKTREVEAVSNQMNHLFLRMIGADEAEKALIRRAEITSEFRIVVYGRNDKLLDPSQDLNGASRRALTIAFVLALTEVSGVEAPNVIDTPLGMMSGYVKREVLRTASDDSSQLVLFLTHSEIAGCEDILDEKAGKVVTMTNPAHYPNILLNEPDVPDARVVMCGCNHRSECHVCARKDDIRRTPGLKEVA